MPQWLLKLTDPRDGRDHYLRWSTAIDAPVEYIGGREQVAENLRLHHGEGGLRNLERYLALLDAKGTTSPLYESAAAVIEGNRAGDSETEATLEEIIDMCLGE